VRFKIKLVAANYLPAMTVQLPLPQSATKRASMAKAPGDEDGNVGLLAGRTYPFQIALTNPLYDPIQVRLAVQRHLPSLQEASEDLQAEAKARRPPFAVSLPSSAFSIAAFAEAWEYEDDDEMFDALEEDDRFSRSPTKDRKSKTKTVGVLERKANLTIVGGEVIVSKEARGNVKASSFLHVLYALLILMFITVLTVQHACVLHLPVRRADHL
jgi:dynactin-4